jgi:N-acetylated-alpha-linked acidic dipeptidase
LPFVFTNLTATARRYTKELQELRDERAREIAARNRAIAEGYYALTSDPRDPTIAPAKEASPPEFDFAPLLNALDSLNAASARFERAYAQWSKSSDADAGTMDRVNDQLMRAERALTSTDGLPKRPWYQHLLYAPGFYTGYGVKTMPGAREAIEQGEWSDVDNQIARIAAALKNEAALVNEAAGVLEKK